MRKLIVVALAPLTLAGCLTAGQQKTLDEACQTLDAVYAVYRAEGTPNAKIEAGYKIGHRACLNPPTNVALAATQVLLAAYEIQRVLD